MELKLDGHKLLYHLDELAKWKRGEDFYPVYVELGPTTVCNHRCVHCYIRYLGFKTVFLDREVMLKNVRQMGAIGVKALCLAGTGEPLLHKACPDVVVEAKKAGLDVAMATNGILLTKKTAAAILPCLTWVRFSVLGGTPATYMKLQGAKEGDFEKLMVNLEEAVALKKKKKLPVTLGVVYFIFRDNGHETAAFARRVKRLGVDYVVVKPVGDYQKNKYVADRALKERFLPELREVETLSSGGFKAQVRWDMFEKWGKKTYEECLSLPFMTVIDADGSVYACGGYWQDKRYCYGNLYRKTFKEIWDSPQRRRITARMQKHVNFDECYNCCRNHSINNFLWGLKTEPAHVNFI